jgi:hypothetical protein
VTSYAACVFIFQVVSERVHRCGAPNQPQCSLFGRGVSAGWNGGNCVSVSAGWGVGAAVAVKQKR